MSLLDMGDNTEQPKGLLGFLQSPQAMALASSLLKSSGYSQQPISLGQAIGQGLTDMQASANQGLDNQYKKANTQNLKSQITQRTKQMQASDDFNNWLKTLMQGQVQQPGQPTPPSTMPPDMMPMGDANGNLQFPYRPGAQMPAPQPSSAPQNNSNMNIAPMNLKLASILAGSGDIAGATNALQKSQEWGKPFSAVNAQGRPVLMQQDKYGNTRELTGLSPLRTGTSLSFNNGNLSFSQGAIGANGEPLDGVIKDPRMSPGRGGQGATYIDTNTGQVISTNTPRQNAIDQQISSGADRLEPILDSIVKNMPQFQHASTNAAEALQGISNRFAGTNYHLPKQKALGEVSINAGAESLMKTLNLPSTNESLEMTKAILAPKYGESEQDYRERVNNDLRNEIRLFQNQSLDRMQNGILLNRGQQTPQTSQSQALTYDPKSRSLR
jgi:hypothetical protein